MPVSKPKIKKAIAAALKEDIGSGDVTTRLLIPKKKSGTGIFYAKQDGVISGLDAAKWVFRKLEKKAVWEALAKDGDRVKAGAKIAEVKASMRTLLTGERTALNFLQRMSGIATLTAQYVEKVSDLPVKILDTRKTAPGLRHGDKYAVRCGGAENHRAGLYDMALIKDNHIKAAGSITAAVNKIKKALPKKMKIEVECATRAQVEETLPLNVDIIMLDNMNVKEMKEAVQLINKKCLAEASGGVTLTNVRSMASTGVDFISVGALTHSVKALDISMKIEDALDKEK